MKKLFLLIVFISVGVYAQDEYVRTDNSIYNFLSRMEALHIINDYNSFETPKTRREIAGYLKQVIENENELNSFDKKILKDYETEFEYELFGTLKNSQGIFNQNGYDVLSQKQKYLYMYSVPQKFNLFINFLAQGEFIGDNGSIPKLNSTAVPAYIGGEIRGDIDNKFGFDLWGINGNVFGNREAAFLRHDLQYNGKLNLSNDLNYFDETQGYLTANFDYVKFKFGRDRINIGYGPIKSLIGDQAPIFNYLAMDIKYKFFTFSYFHGELLGNETFASDTVTGGVAVYEQKYIGYHRIGFNLSDAVNFGIGEFIIYGDRPIDFSYLNPFALYTSQEHSNNNRDNALMFFDYNNKSIKGLKLYGTFLIDDINLSKITTAGWYGNKFLYNIGLDSYNLYNIVPMDLKFEYVRIDPYTYSHELKNDSFTNDGYSLGSSQEPNSELFFTQANYHINYRLTLNASFAYTIHGANILDKNGNVIKNVGGNILLGYRLQDSKIAKFLDGYREYLRSFQIGANYEPFYNITFNLQLRYVDNSLEVQNLKRLESYFTINAQL